MGTLREHSNQFLEIWQDDVGKEPYILRDRTSLPLLPDADGPTCSPTRSRVPPDRGFGLMLAETIGRSGSHSAEIRRYVVLNARQAQAVALWVVAVHAFDEWAVQMVGL
jgi:hypothetical protein